MGFFDDLLIRANCFAGMHLTTSVISDVKEEIDGFEVGSDGEMANVFNKVDTVGSAGVNLFTRIGVYVVVIALIAWGFSILFANSAERGEKKKEVLPKALGIVLIIAPTTLLVVFELFVNGVLVMG